MEKSIISKIAKLLVLIGAINWGLIGIGYFLDQDLNIVEMLLGSSTVASAIVYILVGVSAIYSLIPGRR